MKNLLLILSVATCFMASAANADYSGAAYGSATWFNTDKSTSSQFVNEGDLQEYDEFFEPIFW